MAWTKQGNLKGLKGDKGDQGPRGVSWFTGNGAPGTIANSQAGDLYLDLTSGDVYVLS